MYVASFFLHMRVSKDGFPASAACVYASTCPPSHRTVSTVHSEILADGVCLEARQPLDQTSVFCHVSRSYMYSNVPLCHSNGCGVH